MAFCANCGREIDASAAACPECGHPTGAFVHTASPIYAGFWSRFAAVFIDGLILLIPSLVLGFGFRFGGTFINFLYDWLLIAYWGGQTVGKRALGIRIARPDGSPVDLGVSAARAGMKIVSGLALGLGFLWAAWDPQNRTWHDMVADTRAFRV